MPITLMKKVTGRAPKVWDPSMAGRGSSRCVHESGREGDWLLTGSSPRILLVASVKKLASKSA